MQYVIQTMILMALLERHDILRLFDDKDDRMVTVRIAANIAGIARGKIAAHRAIADLAPGFFDDMKKIADIAFRTLHHEVGQAASALDADAWKFSELLSDQLKLLIH